MNGATDRWEGREEVKREGRREIVKRGGRRERIEGNI
jgi:hypothetical protein